MGGTIFSVVENGVVRVANNVQELVDRVPRINEIANLDFKVVANVDSTNVGIDEWHLLFKVIQENYDAYDGFVVAHGTNTMSYTATALSFALGSDLTKPVVFTGSQLPLTSYGDDAHFNLEHSVRAAVEAVRLGVTEVMVCFHEVVLRGCRTVKISESDFHAFDSPALDPVATIDANGVHFASHARKQGGNSIYVKNRKVNFRASVLCVDLVPGLEPSLLLDVIKKGSVRGVVIKSHGAGSVPDIGDFSLLPFIAEATTMGIPVIVTSKFLGGNSFKKTNDEPAVRALEAGAIASRDMTDVAAQVKLMYLLGSGADYSQIAERFAQSFIGEVS
jgi:L-asparaginase